MSRSVVRRSLLHQVPDEDRVADHRDGLVVHQSAIGAGAGFRTIRRLEVEIWESRWPTNDGPILRRFTKELCNYFETDNLCLFNNGTLALQIALQGMGISGEVITTTFTFVATTHVLYWNKVRPIFVDIEPGYYTIDPENVEAAITPWTTAFLGVHVYGHPCNLNALADIARPENLKLIYDAAHSFGMKVGGKSIAHYGDLSMFSFHATKLYHSLEGAMLIFKQAGLKTLFDYLKNFGFKKEEEVELHLRTSPPARAASPLFAGAGNRARPAGLTARAIRERIRRAMARAGLKGKGLSTASLRMTAAMRLIDEGRGLEEVRRTLGLETAAAAGMYGATHGAARTHQDGRN